MPDDSELHTVRFAFDAAFQRFREASADDPWMAELSNMLHHLYRLHELCKTRLVGFEQQIEPQASALKLERGATWARNCDTHRLFKPLAACEAATIGRPRKARQLPTASAFVQSHLMLDGSALR
jgi:hypothetical protein